MLASVGEKMINIQPHKTAKQKWVNLGSSKTSTSTKISCDIKSRAFIIEETFNLEKKEITWKMMKLSLKDDAVVCATVHIYLDFADKNRTGL